MLIVSTEEWARQKLNWRSNKPLLFPMSAVNSIIFPIISTRQMGRYNARSLDGLLDLRSSTNFYFLHWTSCPISSPALYIPCPYIPLFRHTSKALAKRLGLVVTVRFKVRLGMPSKLGALLSLVAPYICRSYSY